MFGCPLPAGGFGTGIGIGGGVGTDPGGPGWGDGGSVGTKVPETLSFPRTMVGYGAVSHVS
jgi:hypothetical protein